MIHAGANFVRAAYGFSEPLLKGIALGSLGALVAYAVNSFFHNFFDSTLTLWLLIGLSLALVKLSHTSEQPEAEAYT